MNDLLTSLPTTTDACVERMEDIADEMERLGHFRKLIRSQEELRDELAEEFDRLDAHRNRLRVAAAWDSGDMRGLHIEEGSPRGADVGPDLRDPARRALDSLPAPPGFVRQRPTRLFETGEGGPGGGRGRGPPSRRV